MSVAKDHEKLGEAVAPYPQRRHAIRVQGVDLGKFFYTEPSLQAQCGS